MPAEKAKTVANSIKMVTVIISGAEAAAGYPWMVIATMCLGAIANEVAEYYKIRGIQQEYKDKYNDKKDFS
jgi:hypothetical protein